MPNIDWNLTLSLVSLATGIVLSVFAIWLSVYFYTQAKNSESHIQAALGEIRQQTNSLERLSGRMLDRLTKAVTEGRPEHEHRQMILLVEAIRTFQTGGATPPQPQQPTGAPETISPAMIQLVTATVLYAAVANLAFQGLLPDSIADVDPELRQWVDVTALDVSTFGNSLGEPQRDWPIGARNNYAAMAQLRAGVRDTIGAYQARAGAAAPPAPPPGHS